MPKPTKKESDITIAPGLKNILGFYNLQFKLAKDLTKQHTFGRYVQLGFFGLGTLPFETTRIESDAEALKPQLTVEGASVVSTSRRIWPKASHPPCLQPDTSSVTTVGWPPKGDPLFARETHRTGRPWIYPWEPEVWTSRFSGGNL